MVLLPILAVMLLASCDGGSDTPPPPPPGAIPAGESIGSASVTGRVVLDSPPPPRQKLKITEATCRREHSEEPLSEAVVTNTDGSLRNVVVHVKSGLAGRIFAPPRQPAILDQKGCLYAPHVIAVQTDQIVTFVNSDPTLHNVHAVTKINPAFNIGMAVEGQKVSRFFGKPEIVKMKCDVHAWMASYIGVFDNPFHAVTGDGGSFDLEGLPAGTYEIEAWHETYGAKSQSVTLADREARTIEFRYGG